MKSLWKWCAVGVIVVTVLSVLVGTPGGKAQDSGWTTQVLAEGADTAKNRVIYPDVAVDSRFNEDPTDDHIYVTYIDQAANTVWLLVSKKGGAPGSWEKFEVTKPTERVNGTAVAVDSFKEFDKVCVVWQQFGDAGPEVWQRCAEVRDGDKADVKWQSDPVRVSGEGLIAGQHDLQGDWSGSFDNYMWSTQDGFIEYVIWTEDYTTLKAAKSKDGVTKESCGEFPDQDATFVRFPTIYVDAKGRVFAGATQTASPADVQVWVSYDQCATWKGPTNVTANAGFSDAPEFAVIGDKFYSDNDDTTTNPNNVDINFSECDVTPDAGLANCKGTRAIIKDAAWARMKVDEKGNLHVVGNNQGETGLVDYCFSSDGGATWKGEAIPNSKPNNPGFRDPDYGIIIARNNIAVDWPAVYVVWNTRGEGKSKIMLSVRSAPPAKDAAATCAP
ncbi:MAG: hypothetical protein QXT77_05595 [Candidatus Methanomethylicaceae archaeon]